MWAQQSGEPEDRIAVLARLFVVKAGRKHALGEALMRAAMSFGRKHRVRLVLDVMTKDTAAMRLYEHLGWQAIGRTSHHFGAGGSIGAVCYVSPDA
ncbi:GNAT family N-acetyltransferase [Streptomyces sp. NPDC057621]|uniref:GNAT family N-acetyltransferase n=1 Tax=Streptomyces sp. NPDC057621 TaxID=3346186 RepID=UPI003685B6CC